MLLGVITPDGGTVDLAGHRLPKRRSKAMEHVGFVAGYLPLPDRLRVREALSVFAGFYGMTRAAGDAALAAGLERFQIEHLADRLLHGALLGAAHARRHREVVAAPPQLLVLDEPTASLDPDVADRVRSGLLELNADEGTALLVTSHNMLEVERLCGACRVHVRRPRSSPTARPWTSSSTSAGATSKWCSSTSPAATGRWRDEPPPCGTVVRWLFLVLWRNPARWFDIAVWPLFDVILFGSLGAFVAQENEASRAATPYLLAGIMLFHVLFQSQVGIATGFMEETWSRNLLNMMTTPLTELKYAAGWRPTGS